jgi:hypothetical protein
MAQPAYQYQPTPPVAPASPSPGYGWAGLAVRAVLTLTGAAGLIVGGFLDWIRGIAGVDLTGRAFIQTTFRHGKAFVTSAGFVMIVLGLLAIIGLALRSGWLTRVSGVLGVVGFVLFVVQVYRASLTVSDVQAGAWIALAGGIVALIGGFFGTRRVVVAGPAPPTAVVEGS